MAWLDGWIWRRSWTGAVGQRICVVWARLARGAKPVSTGLLRLSLSDDIHFNEDRMDRVDVTIGRYGRSPPRHKQEYQYA